MNIGEKIKNIRLAHNMTQEQLSVLSGISLPSIRKYELGERNPKPDQLLKISEALGISINVFLDFEIRTISDLLSLIFKMNEQIDMQINAETDDNGNFLPHTVTLLFLNKFINQKLCAYLSAQKKKDELVATKESYTTEEYCQKSEIINQNISDLVNLLLDDDTDITKITDGISSVAGETAKTSTALDTDSSFSFSSNNALQELFLDCTPDEANLLLESAKILKNFIRKTHK